MIFTHYTFSSIIDLNTTSVQRIVFEDPSTMGKMISELKEQINGYEGSFSLFENNHYLDMSKYVSLIIDPFSIDLNSKEILSGLYGSIANHIECGDHFIHIRNAISTLVSEVINAASEVEMMITNEDPTTPSLLKALAINIMDSDNLGDKICEYSRLLFAYSNKKLLIVVNLDQFMSIDEYNACIHQLLYQHTPIILIESTFKNDVPTKIIDQDLCEINLKID